MQQVPSLCVLYLVSAGTAEEAVCSQGEETGKKEGEGVCINSAIALYMLSVLGVALCIPCTCTFPIL